MPAEARAYGKWPMTTPHAANTSSTMPAPPRAAATIHTQSARIQMQT